jgi:hypothetical protein
MTSLTNRFNTRLTNRLIVMKKYGPIYLSEAEYRQRLEEIIQNYHAFLAENLLEFREKEFWEYHQKVLQELGVPLSRTRLIWPLFFGVVQHLLRPRRTARNIAKFIREGRQGSGLADLKKLDMIAERGPKRA